MISAIFWNIRGVKSKKAIHRLKNLITINKVAFVAIMEPFVQKEKIEGYKKFMGFHQCISNDNGKIWCFWTTNCQTTTMTNEDQQITINISEGGEGNGLFVTAVYAKCTSTERSVLWHSLERLNAMVNGPWCVGGDFNSILDTNEKLG